VPLPELVASDVVRSVEEKAVLTAEEIELLDAGAGPERMVQVLPWSVLPYGVPVVGSMATAS
jgi:hypothetical protein